MDMGQNKHMEIKLAKVVLNVHKVRKLTLAKISKWLSILSSHIHLYS